MAWGKLTSKTLESNGLDITTDQFTSQTFLQLLTHSLRVTSTANGRWQFGDDGTIDTGSVYASRRSIDGGSEITAINQSYIWYRGDSDSFTVGYMINIGSEEKLVMGHDIHVGAGTGAGTAPSRQEWTGKWVETTNQCDKVNADNGGSNNIATDSNLSVLGSDFTKAPPTVQDGAVFEETDTNKHYLLDDGTWTEI